MTAQKVATGIAVAALTALLVGVGLPALLPSASVPPIEMVDTVGDAANDEDQSQNSVGTNDPNSAPRGDDNDDADDRPADDDTDAGAPAADDGDGDDGDD